MPDGRLEQVRWLRAAGRDDEYLAAAQALARDLPDDVAVRIEAAYACDRFGTEADAVRHYDAAARLGGAPDGERAGFLLGYGSTLRNVGRVEESVATLSAAAAEFPANRALAAFLALALHSAGRHAEAVATLLDVVLSLKDSDAELASYARALAHYRDALRGGSNA